MVLALQNKVFWLGQEFDVYEMTGAWNPFGGLYIFAKQEPNLLGVSQWRAVYVGKTKNFKDRLSNHEKWLIARLLYGATHVHARVEERSFHRTILEQRLIQYCRPSLNVQHS